MSPRANPQKTRPVPGNGRDIVVAQALVGSIVQERGIDGPGAHPFFFTPRLSYCKNLSDLRVPHARFSPRRSDRFLQNDKRRGEKRGEGAVRGLCMAGALAHKRLRQIWRLAEGVFFQVIHLVLTKLICQFLSAFPAIAPAPGAIKPDGPVSSATSFRGKTWNTSPVPAGPGRGRSTRGCR